MQRNDSAEIIIATQWIFNEHRSWNLIRHWTQNFPDYANFGQDWILSDVNLRCLFDKNLTWKRLTESCFLSRIHFIQELHRNVNDTDVLFETTLKLSTNQPASRAAFFWMESVFYCIFKVLQILFDKFKSSIVDLMCNLLIAVFRGKFAEAIDLGEKEKLEIPGGWGGGCSKTLRNGNSRGVGGSKVKNLPWVGRGMDIFWNCTLQIKKINTHTKNPIKTLQESHFFGRLKFFITPKRYQISFRTDG